MSVFDIITYIHRCSLFLFIISSSSFVLLFRMAIFFYLMAFIQFTGIEFLCENHLLQMDPQDVAHFLYKGEGLNKTAIGMFKFEYHCVMWIEGEIFPLRLNGVMVWILNYCRRLPGRKEWIQRTSFEGIRRTTRFYQSHFGASFEVSWELDLWIRQITDGQMNKMWNRYLFAGNFYGHFDCQARHRRLIEWWNALHNAIVN